jgi:uncharacterized protein YecE (DUF72 family)
VEILIGTSGYSYDDWVGPVYPEGTPRRDFFRIYSRLFSFAELNYSYYSFPASRTLGALQEKSPEGFRFAVKGHRSMTHEASDDIPSICARFTEALAPLEEAGSLASVLLQFPYSFHYTRENRLRLDQLCRGLEKLPVHLEFRNTDWFQHRVTEELARRGVGIVLSDYPPLEGLPDFTPRSASPTVYARFHGRNSAAWWKGTNVTRYDYRYSRAELAERVPALKKLAASASVLLVAFNNHYKGQAVENARELKGLLEG